MTTQPGTALIIGGTSDIGRATALVYAEHGWKVILTARNGEEGLREVNHLLTASQAKAELCRLDILDTESFGPFIDSLGTLPNTVVCVVGMLPTQSRAVADTAYASLSLRTNFEGPAILLGMLADRFEQRGTGTIVGVSSVAGNRGRASNYVYGSAKAGLTAFLSGLRGRLWHSGVRVVTVMPGFVRTRMTDGMKLSPFLTAEPDEVAEAIYEAAELRHRDIIYVRRSWRLVMGVIAAMPEGVFKRVKF
ncbi:MAG: SDR family oxidoreductase [Mesorhizobium sp.]|uniref:SDR family oxidoreductase n=1 Tax=Mesorhizobium sp. TaxID=1871066 RepID=UPI000FEA3F92|nr:SDR family oxidoreductase [Mesorhizobium sp.]RWI30027.1 MAG: SDR family oxidoreductase [Mesorhizobium sp.]RWK53399.1 MAG: SDR family oxidoreductase [Mesorhizobium sp.]RWK98397.1 MAG: SDR family oxidoreductase [Mesorhizobium sp.]TIP58463.1 MAG: SDR family oxidoreductase [Mesorhizobium sp.]TIQ19460.1 MAG: SDR family oxidoreductase [Mesorhizobium sp.]